MKELNWNDVVINKDGTYSTLKTEVKKDVEYFTGYYWVNGKPIYAIYKSGTLPTITSTRNVTLLSLDSKIIPIQVYGNLVHRLGTIRIVGGETNNGGVIIVASNHQDVMINVGTNSSDATYEILLEYIKED